MKRRISKKRKLLFAAVVTAILLALLEFGARLVEFIRPEQEIARTIDIPAKEAGAYRIMIVGGSTAFGAPVRQFGFPFQLEFWLRVLRPERPLEVYNLAMVARTSAFVGRMLEKNVSHDPDLLIVMSGHNEFLNRKVDSNPPGMIDRFALARVMARGWSKVRDALGGSEVLPDRIAGYEQDSRLFQKKVRSYLNNLESIAEVAQRNGTPLLILTAPSNLADWPPAFKRLENNNYEEEYEALIAEMDALIVAGHSDRAVQRLDKLLESRRNDPLLLYLLAKAHAATGRHAHAESLFARAKDLDPMPWRALTEFNEAVRKIAGREGIILCDVEKSFQRHAPHGHVGFPLVADNVHPTPLGNTIIAREILKVMKRNGIFVDRDLEAADPQGMLGHFLEKTLTSEERLSQEINYLLMNARYSMKLPFLNLRASKMYLDKAVAMDSSNWEVRVNLATVAFFENRIDEGRRQLRQAVELRGKPIDVNDRKSAPYLKESLEQCDIPLAELTELLDGDGR